MTLHVAVQQSLQRKHLCADAALKLGRVRFRPDRGKFFGDRFLRQVRCHRVLDAVAAVDQFDRHVRWNSKLKIEFDEINIFSNAGWFSILLVRKSINLGNILRVALFENLK